MPPPLPATGGPRRQQSLRIAGFPLHVRPGFLLFMLLVVLLNGETLLFGLWLAALMAAFTLLHELGHALAARAADCRAEISLDFLAGYASFVPSRPLRGWERIGISLAGPAVQIAAGLAVFVAVGGAMGWPLESDSPAQFAALWAGPVIGVFNLIPILPFDGGHVLQVMIEWVAPRRARTIMYGITLGVSGLTIALMVASPAWRPLAIFAVVPLITVVQMITADRERGRAMAQRAAETDAEAAAWRADDLSGFARTSHVPSPWFRAWQQLRAGQADIARDILLADLADAGSADWSPPTAAPREALRQVAALLPRPVPQGRVFSMHALCDVLMRTGDYREAGLAAAECYRQQRVPLMAVSVARAAAALGDRATAIAWLSTAAQYADGFALRATVDSAPEFASLRGDREFERIVA
ncbi:MAG: metalloprotease [Ilumatobacteraceae bacterium]